MTLGGRLCPLVSGRSLSTAPTSTIGKKVTGDSRGRQ